MFESLKKTEYVKGEKKINKCLEEYVNDFVLFEIDHDKKMGLFKKPELKQQMVNMMVFKIKKELSKGEEFKALRFKDSKFALLNQEDNILTIEYYK